ncbi:MAG: acyltransferase family protein [Clostridium sp.]|nr:acyltransferase family protein [Clostridium sp.]
MASDKANDKDQKYNMTFCILSGIAIVMIVAGHVGYDIMTVGGLFPYYSFHVPLFLFISGYFYKEEEEAAPLAYCLKKIKRLMIPYFIWNLLYGILAWMLRLCGFAMGEGISFKTLFISPFLHGYQFIYNYAAWFVPVLFVIEMMNIVMRLLLKRLRLCHESLILAVSLIIGMIVVWFAIGGHVWGLYKAPGRILFLYPCFQMGQFYHKKLEKYDTLGSPAYFGIVIGLQLVLIFSCNGLAYSSVWCTGFMNGPAVPYLTAVTGIAFWLRVARIITPAFEKSKAVLYLGKNTYAVMLHHIMAFMLVEMIIAAFAEHTPWLADFDGTLYRTNIDYYYMIRGAEEFKMVYLLAGIILPLLLQYGLDRIGIKIKERRNEKSDGKPYNNR